MNSPQQSDPEKSSLMQLGDALHSVRVFGLWYRLAAIESAIYVTPLIVILSILAPSTLTNSVSLPALSLTFVLTIALFFGLVRQQESDVTDVGKEIDRGVWHMWREATQTEQGHTRAIACNLAFLAAIGSAYLTVVAAGMVQSTAGQLTIVSAPSSAIWAASSLVPLAIGCLLGLFVLAGGFSRFVSSNL